MQSELRLAQYFSPIRGLRGVVVTSVGDCLPYADWRRAGETWEPQAIAATWELMLSHGTSLGAIGVHDEVGFTIESATMTLIFTPIEERFGLTYVFGSDVPLGVARLRVQMLAPVLREVLRGHEPQPQAASESVPPEIAEPPAPAPEEPAEPLSATEPFEDVVDAENELPVSAASPTAGSVNTPPAAVAVPTVSVPPATTQVKAPVTANATSKVPTVRTRPAASSAPPRRSFARAGIPAPMSPPRGGRANESASMGSRLLAYLERYAPDTHAALLRVSLQTGLPVTLLRQPDNLSADEFTQVAESVRNILGVEQLNL